MRTPLRVITSVVALSCLGAVLSLPASAVTSTTQTTQEPSFGTPLTHLMKQVFSAIESGNSSTALQSFFPEAPYVSMKAGLIAYPAADYKNRLVAFFKLDLAAYRNAFAGRMPSTFVGVNANPKFAQWIAPGACENSIGYWHVPGVRMVVRRNGRLVSAAVFSLISWRGQWYVIHLGPNPRPRNVGTVAEFHTGRGVAGPAGGC